MRLIQKTNELDETTKGKETPSLNLWLSRDVPHERELASELLNKLGREKSLETLLALHDKEETLRQKRLSRHMGAFHACLIAVLLLAFVVLYTVCAIFFPPFTLNMRVIQVCLPLSWGFVIAMHVFNVKLWRGKKGKTPFFSTPVQQNLITALLDYADTPLVSEPLARAIVYYSGDRDRLYEKLAHVLSLLPDDPDALTGRARAILWRRLSPAAVYPYPGEKERGPALRSAITRYFARTGKLDKKWWQ